MAISLDDARHAARLARIRVEDHQLPALAEELSAIIGFMERISEAPVDHIEPMTSVTPMKLKLRADTVTSGKCRDDVLANAPDVRDGFFVVPKVVE